MLLCVFSVYPNTKLYKCDALMGHGQLLKSPHLLFDVAVEVVVCHPDLELHAIDNVSDAGVRFGLDVDLSVEDLRRPNERHHLSRATLDGHCNKIEMSNLLDVYVYVQRFSKQLTLFEDIKYNSRHIC